MRFRERLRRWLPGSRRVREELDEEIRTHLELRTRDLVAGGMDPESARREAERRFGDLEAARRRLYASAITGRERARLGRWVDALGQDLRGALRRIRATPGFSLLSLATFALGIGLTTTMFAVVDAALLRPLPLPEPDRLVALYSVAEDGSQFPWVSSTNWLDWREQSRTLAATALYQLDRVTIASGAESERIDAARVGGPFFDTVRPRLVAGRPITTEEADERAPVAMVSEQIWNRVLGSSPELGELIIEGVPHDVVGVVARGQDFPEETDLWLPAVFRRMSGAARNNINWLAVARLADGVAPDAARADLDRIATAIRESEPEAIYSWGVGVVPLREAMVGDAEDALALLMGAVLMVLLVACANLAGQGYVRALATVDEAAVRMALGASRWRLLQGQLVEHVVLGMAGGVAGLGASVAVVRWLQSGGLPLPRAETLAIDGRVVVFTVALSLAAGLLAGLVPSLRLSGASPGAGLGSVRGAAAGARVTTATVLVAAEIALSAMLLLGGAMLMRGFVDFTGRDLGFEPDGLLVAEIELAGPEYEAAPARLAFWDRLLEESRALPGAGAVALSSETPGRDRSGYGVLRIADDPEMEGAAATYRVVSDGYFAALGLPLQAGRDFGPQDAPGSARVAVVSRAMAERYWPGESALGKRFQAISMESPVGAPEIAVIGVVADLDSGYGVEERPAMYVLHRQAPPWMSLTLGVVARATTAPVALADSIRERVRGLDAALAPEIGTVRAHLSRLLARDRLVMSILNGFALLALLLAAIGVHGLLSFVVARRTREIAVRTALGADHRRILIMVVGGALRLGLAGAGAGALAAWWLSSWLDSQVTTLEPGDPTTFLLVIAALLAASVVAAALPAWRAVRLDPASALRAD